MGYKDLNAFYSVVLLFTMDYQIGFGIVWFLMCSFMIVRFMAYTKMKKLFSMRRKKELILVFLAAIGMGIIPLIYLVTDWLTPFIFSIPMAFQFSGIFIYVVGLGFLFWVHLTLSHNWSPILEINKKHKLITHGPYKFIRHPLYLAFYIMVIGQWIATSNWFVGLFGFILWSIFYFSRIEHEEKLMFNFFGKEYKKYMLKTGRLFPRFKF